jgi:hypothetical protein
MRAEPIPLFFQIYFYSAIAIALVVSLIAVIRYRRAVLRNMLGTSGTMVMNISSAGRSQRAPSIVVFANAYRMIERRLTVRLSVIYGTAILSVAMFSVWIRFFRGNSTLITGSIMFMMWREHFANDGVALVASAMLFASIGVPLIAVLLAWSWRRAVKVFVMYLAAWVAVAYTLVVVIHFIRASGTWIFDWAFALILAQAYLILPIAPQPFLLLLATGHRRVRAVAPITLAGSFVLCAALFGQFFLVGVIYQFQLVRGPVLKALGHSGILFIIAGIVALCLCWGLLRVLATLYEKKRYSDRQLLVDCWSLVLILFVFARLGEAPGTPQLLIALAFVVFCAYRCYIELALRLLVWRMERPPSRCLLLLRTFGFQKRTEKLFDAIGQRWRFQGSVLMIAGTDLATRSINPADYLRFLSRRFRDRFIRTDADLQRNLERLDDRPDPDGRYRINELFCDDNAWQKAAVALLDRADVVLMDLRGLGPKKQGSLFELQQLVERGPLGHVLLLVDATTDRNLLDATIHDTWSNLSAEERKERAAEPMVMAMSKGTRREMNTLFDLLQGQAHVAVPASTA